MTDTPQTRGLTDLPSGSTLGGFRIDGILGRGAMGVVYRATDIRLQRPVALKVVAGHLAEDEAFRERFISEARAAAMVEHPGIVAIYASGEEDGVPYIAMRLIEGGELSGLVEHAGRLAPQEALRILAPIASALDAAERAGIVHRDVKPSNILVPSDGSGAVLVDFGIGRIKGSSRNTQSGSWLGTPNYVAPEQVQGGDIDGRADQYALTCVLYELLAGEPPFVRDQDMQTLWAHVNEEPPSLVGRVPAATAAIDDVIRRGMAKDPEDRFPTAFAMIDAASVAFGLAAAAGGAPPPPPRGTGTVQAGSPPPAAAPARQGTGTVIAGASPPPSAKGRGRLVALGAIALVAVALVGVVLATRGGDEPASGTQSAADADAGSSATTSGDGAGGETSAGVDTAAAQEAFDATVLKVAKWRTFSKGPNAAISRAFNDCYTADPSASAMRACMRPVASRPAYDQIAEWFDPLAAELSTVYNAGAADPAFADGNRVCYEKANRAIELGTGRAALAGELYAALAAGNVSAAADVQSRIDDELTAFDGTWNIFVESCGLPARFKA